MATCYHSLLFQCAFVLLCIQKLVSLFLGTGSFETLPRFFVKNGCIASFMYEICLSKRNRTGLSSLNKSVVEK